MHIPRWTVILLVTLAFATGAALTAVAQSRKQLKQAQKLLAQIKLVDGAGSGLDADTVQGITPSQLKASITPPSPAEILSAVKSVDGAGSGLDADKLQGLTPAQVCSLGLDDAAALFTSAVPVNAGNNASCNATNVGTTPLDITVELLDEPSGSLRGPTTCANLAPGHACAQFVFDSPQFRLLTCKVTPKSNKVRGMLINVNTGITSEVR
jgi:hypothetical protein